MPSRREKLEARLRWQQETECFASFVIPENSATMGDRDRVVATGLSKNLFPVPPQNRWQMCRECQPLIGDKLVGASADAPGEVSSGIIHRAVGYCAVRQTQLDQKGYRLVDPPTQQLQREERIDPEAPCSDSWSRLLPFGGGVIQHTRKCSSRDSPDEVLGEHLMTQGEHRFCYTVLRGSGTGMRVGVASANGSQTVGIRLYDGRVVHSPGLSAEPGSPRWLRENVSKSDGDGRRKWALPIALGGAELPPQLVHEFDPQRRMLWDRLPGAVKIELVVNLTARSLVFTVGSNSIEAGITLPEGGIRMWFESKMQNDAIAVTEYRAGPAPTCSKAPTPAPRSSLASTRMRPLPASFEQDQEVFTKKMAAAREASASSPGPGAYNVVDAFRTKVGKGLAFSFGPQALDESRSDRGQHELVNAPSVRKAKHSFTPSPRQRGSFKGDTSSWAARLAEGSGSICFGDGAAGNGMDLSHMLRRPTSKGLVGQPKPMRPHSARASLIRSNARGPTPSPMPNKEESRLLDALAEIRAIALRVQGVHADSSSSTKVRVH